MDWYNIREDIEKGYDFTAWNGFGYVMNDSLHNFDYWEADKLAYDILDLHNSLWLDPTATVPTISFANVTRKTFVVTGSVHHFKNRDEVKVAIETRGGKVTNSVTGNTDYLINNDIKTVRDLVMLSETDLKDLKGFGTKALDEVKEKLTELNI